LHSQDPEKYLAPLISAGASSITIQIEPFMAQYLGQPEAAVAAAAEVAAQIRGSGLKAGLALGVDTPLTPEVVKRVQEGMVDMVSGGSGFGYLG
jgi:pentose-5-phosphate-3-epimerase